MALKLEICNDEDIERVFTILSIAFGHHHTYIDTCFPNHETTSGRRIGGERLLAIINGDPNVTILKVIDTITDKIIAQAKWNIYNNVISEEIELDRDYYETNDKKEYAYVTV